MLPINEIFETIQGEATFTGTPSVFIRLQGCDVGCAWCDTKHTWPVEDIDMIDAAKIPLKEQDSLEWGYFSSEDIILQLNQFTAKHIVLTGGEPCTYDLTNLTTKLIEHSYSVQIETSGTKPIKAHSDTFVTLSPKWDMAGGLKVLDSNYDLASEVKVPIGKNSDIQKLLERVPQTYMLSDRPIWLQPLSQSKKATAVCMKAAIKHKFKISIQTHKFIGIR